MQSLRLVRNGRVISTYSGLIYTVPTTCKEWLANLSNIQWLGLIWNDNIVFNSLFDMQSLRFVRNDQITFIYFRCIYSPYDL